MTNYADHIDALSAQDHEPQTELARARLALAEAHRLNRELVEALEYWMPDETMVRPYEQKIWNEHRAVLAKVKP